MIITKRKRDINLFVLQFGAAVAVSFAGFLSSRFWRRKRAKPSLPSLQLPSSDDRCRSCLDKSATKEDAEMKKKSKDDLDDKDVFLLPEFEDVVKEFDSSICRDNISPSSDPLVTLAFPSKQEENEMKQLRNTIREIREREKSLEAKLLEYYCLREQQTVAAELRNRLKLNQMESKMFNLKIQSLKCENAKMKARSYEHARVLSELEAAKSRIQLLTEKLQIDVQRNKEQILPLQGRVGKLQEQELKPCRRPDPDPENTIQTLKNLEAEIDEQREVNTRLHIEKSELVEKLATVQITVNPEIESLLEENEEIKRKIEQLQSDRCNDLEELVYLRWINACLRYELRNYKRPLGKTAARDLSITLSPKSEQKAKSLILEYARTEGLEESTMDLDDDQWSSSMESLITDSEYLDDSSIDTNKPRKQTLMRKLRKILHGKETKGSSRTSNDPSCGLRSSQSMDFQMLMKNTIEDEFKEQSETAASMSLCSEGYGESGLDERGKKELMNYAEALRKSGSCNKKMHKKSVSYFY